MGILELISQLSAVPTDALLPLPFRLRQQFIIVSYILYLCPILMTVIVMLNGTLNSYTAALRWKSGLILENKTSVQSKSVTEREITVFGYDVMFRN